MKELLINQITTVLVTAIASVLVIIIKEEIQFNAYGILLAV